MGGSSLWQHMPPGCGNTSAASPPESQGYGRAEVLSDYRGYDLRRQWEGRGRTTRLEGELIIKLAATVDRQRWLELGCGYGRLTPLLAGAAGEFVASDLNAEALSSVPAPAGPRHFLRVAANLYHLPFEQDSFTVVSLIRVLHHLEDPKAALREIFRVLAPGGSLLLSYAPKPTLGSLQQDILQWLRGAPPGTTYTTFSRKELDFLGETPFPVLVPRATFVHQLVGETGGMPATELGHGPEALERFLPLAASRALSLLFGTTLLGSTRILLCRKPGGSAGSPLVRQLSWRCPRCQVHLDPPPTGRETTTLCPQCAFPLKQTPGMIDARYIPPHARWVSAKDHGPKDDHQPTPDRWRQAPA